MNDSEFSNSSTGDASAVAAASRFDFAIIGFVSALVLLTAFLTSVSTLGFAARTTVFAATVVLYVAFCTAFFLRRARQARQSAAAQQLAETTENFPSVAAIAEELSLAPEIAEKLQVLEEADKFFSGSLKTAETFRLIANRVGEIVPFQTAAMFLANEARTKLALVCAEGDDAEAFRAAVAAAAVETVAGEGAAGAALLDDRAMFGRDLSFENNLLGEEKARALRSAAAVPLRDANHGAFGVLALYGAAENAFDSESALLLEEISRRVSPLILKSLNFERNLENSLTDALTNLPNERAFYLVLENQIAESQRLREQRPLTVLSFDVRGFDELNQKYGHATGDRALVWTAKLIKGQLRQMDLLSRTSGDEFLAVLPTASADITKVIVERIEKAFTANLFEIAAEEKISLRLNFGAASFIADGETAGELIKRAQLRKQEAKSDTPGAILFFSREYAN